MNTQSNPLNAKAFEFGYHASLANRRRTPATDKAWHEYVRRHPEQQSDDTRPAWLEGYDAAKNNTAVAEPVLLIHDQWEYLCMLITAETPHKTEDQLNALGYEGWELTAVTPAVAGFVLPADEEHHSHHDHGQAMQSFGPLRATAYFKRRLYQ